MVSTEVFLKRINRSLADGSLDKGKALQMIRGKKSSVKARITFSNKDLKAIASFENRFLKKKKSAFFI